MLSLVPTVPKLLTVDNTTFTTITLSWMRPNPPNGIIIGYQLEYRISYDLPFSLLSPSNNELTRTVTGLTPNTEYQFRVAATTVVGRGPYTDVVTQNTSSEFSRIYCTLQMP